MKFLSKISFVFIISIFIIALSSCSNNEKEVVVAEQKNEATISIDPGDCIEMTFRIQKKLKFRDTTISLRRSKFTGMKVLICCDTNQISYALEKILLKSDYSDLDFLIDSYYYPIDLLVDNYYYIVLDKSYQDKKEIGFYYYEPKKSYEVIRFLVQNNKIIGIDPDPSNLTPFLTPKEYKDLFHEDSIRISD
jgi:hypothetical protein